MRSLLNTRSHRHQSLYFPFIDSDIGFLRDESFITRWGGGGYIQGGGSELFLVMYWGG